MTTIRIPIYRPHFSDLEADLVRQCLDSTWISSKGVFIERFEAIFSDYVGAKHSLTINNGTAALHIALAALGIGPGDEVIVPTLTYIASANAVSYTGACPIFADSEAEHWQIDVRAVEAAITPRTRAIMPVHLYGHSCDMDAVVALARRHGLFVVEDCAEAIGTRYGGRHVGTFGDTAAFSFFGNKTITTGEGGMVVTDDPKIADLASRLKGQGLAPGREYWHDIVGYNYRMTNICAAIGCAQMESIDWIVEKKRQIADWYRDDLASLPLQLHRTSPKTTHSHWMVSFLAESSEDRDRLRMHLKKHGIETRPFFNPIHLMPMYRKPGIRLPVAEDLGARGMNLPSYPDLTRDDVAFVTSTIRSFFG